MSFSLLFLAEYGHIIPMSCLVSLLFFGGPASFTGILGMACLALKTTAVAFAFVWLRASFPRRRYDKLMYLLWKSYLPFNLGLVVFVAGLLIGLDAVPFIWS